MTVVFSGRNVNHLFPQLIQRIDNQGSYPSRNGPVKRFIEPVVITYEKPQERILFSDIRDANPFFHFFETLWMLDGRDDLGFLLPFNPRMAEYSDDGKLVRGSAYGVRWRSWYDTDQLRNLIERLRKDPYDRRTVLTMWDARTDLTVESKDVPCNTHTYFSYTPSHTSSGYLDITVCNRSNDLIYGCCGSNVFHFSFLLEYIAGMSGLEVGHYHQFTNNLHIYTDNHTANRCLDQKEHLTSGARHFEYPNGHQSLFTEGANLDSWNAELNFFLRTGSIDDFNYSHRFFPDVAYPLWMAHKAYKDDSLPKTWEGYLARQNAALAWVVRCKDDPLRMACVEWLNRRMRIAHKKYHG